MASRAKPFGLNTEDSPLFLRERNHPQFQNIRYKGNVLLPRAGNSTYTTPTGTELWLAQQLGVSDVARLHVEQATVWHAYCALAATGDVTIRNPAGTTEALTIDEPAAAPTLAYVKPGVTPTTVNTFGVGPGETITVAARYATALGAVSGLSTTTEVTNSYVCEEVTSLTGVFPTDADDYGITVTGQTSGATAVFRGSQTSQIGDGKRYFALTDVTGTFQAETIEWTAAAGAGTGSIAAAPAADVNVDFYFDAPAGTPDTDVTLWEVFVLAASGYYYTGNGDGSVVLANAYRVTDTEDSLSDLSVYDGPLDENNLPETLLHLADIGYARAVAVNKECLFVAIGDEIYISEPTEYRQFRSGYALRARGTILKMVTRPYGLDSIVQVFTTAGVDVVVGAPPYFEIRPTGINEAPAAQESIITSDVGTWALYDDGWYVQDGFSRVNVTYQINTDWIEAIADPTAVVSGADKGIVYLIDATGRGLAYDWEQKQFFETPYTTQPDGFYWSETSRVLVAKIGSSYEQVGQGSASVAWTVQFPTQGGQNESTTPEGLQIIGEGTMTVSYYVDDELMFTEALDPSDEDDNMIPLPVDFAREWYVVLSGTGTEANTEIRGVAYVP